MSVIGLDIGRDGVKVYTEGRRFTFPAIVGEWNVRKLVTDYADKGFEIEVDGVRKFIGDLAEFESNHKRRMLIDKKATEDARFLALTAIHQTGILNATIVTGLPVEQHDPDHKREFRELLLGTRSGLWDVVVNGVRLIIKIQDVKIAVEGGAAFWSAPMDGLVRTVDAGSKTVNYITMMDRRYVYRDSGTLPFGFNTLRKGSEVSVQDFADKVAGELGAVQWDASDTILVAGGKAVELAEALRAYFPRAAALPNPLFANAIGFYNAGRAVIDR